MKWLQIESSEKKLLGITFLFVALLGVAQVLVAVTSMALFLVNYDSSLLSYGYIGGGISVFLIGFALRFLQNKLSFDRLIKVMLSVLSVLFVLSLIVLTKLRWVALALFLCSEMTFSFIQLIILTLTTEIFTLQEGKKFFGIIGSARALGGGLAGLMIPVLVQRINSTSIVFIAVLILCFEIGLLSFLKASFPARFTPQKKVENRKVSFSKVSNKAYVVSLFLTVFIFTASYLSLQFVFNSEVKIHFVNEADIARFLGVFSASTNVLSILAGFFLFRWLLDKFGLITTLFITPVMLCCLLSFTILTHLISAPLAIVFAALSFTVLFERAMIPTVNNGAISLLYQPIRPDEKGWVQFQSRMMIQPLSVIVVGFSLFLINYLSGDFNVLCASLFVCLGLIVVLFVIKDNYIKMLMTALNKQNIIKPEFIQLDRDSLHILSAHLKSRFPEEVIYTLRTIEGLDLNQFTIALGQCLQSDFLDVRLFVLKKIEEKRLGSFLETVEKICLNETNANVLGAAVIAYSALSGGEIPPPCLLNEEIASSCLIAKLRYGSKSTQAQVVESLLKMAHSSDEGQKEIAASVIQSGDLKDERFIPPFIEGLILSKFCKSAVKSLQLLEPIEYIIENFDRFSPPLKLQCFRLLRGTKSEKAIPFLEKWIDSAHRDLSRAAIIALKHQHYRPSLSGQIDRVQKALISENEKLLFLKEVVNLSDAPLLSGLLKREVELIQERLLILLSFIYPGDPILAVIQGFLTEDKNAISFATEILLHTLNREDVVRFIPQLIFRPNHSPTKKGCLEEVLPKILEFAPHCHIDVIHSAVLYTIYLNKLSSLRDLALKRPLTEDPLYQEISACLM